MAEKSIKIDETAIVSKNVELDREVEIGPYCKIADGVIIGRGTKLQGYVIIEKGVRIGENNIICYGAVIGTEPQDKKFKGEFSQVYIGNNNIIREYVTINRATGEGEETVIGDDNFLMINSHIGHNCIVGSRCVLTNNVALGGHVEVEDDVVIGGLTGVHQFVRIGRLAMIGGCSAVRQDVPPYALVAGVPARIRGVNTVGINRAKIDKQAKDEIKKIYKLLFTEGMNIKKVLEQIENRDSLRKETLHLVEFLETATKRGILRFEKE